MEKWGWFVYQGSRILIAEITWDLLKTVGALLESDLDISHHMGALEGSKYQRKEAQPC